MYDFPTCFGLLLGLGREAPSVQRDALSGHQFPRIVAKLLSSP